MENRHGFYIITAVCIGLSLAVLKAESVIPANLDGNVSSVTNGRFSTDVFEGDILGVDSMTALEETAPLTVSATAVIQGQNNAVARESLKWSNGIVPYVISSALRVSGSEEGIKQLMRLISAETDNCVRFVSRTAETDYVRLVQVQHGCASRVGRVGRRQEIHLDAYCAQSKGDIIHELMHTLGFLHEHTRTDRDEYIQIHLENIIDYNVRDNFFNSFVATTLGLPYDYLSIMHYPPNAFAKPSAVTITPKKPFPIGHNLNLSYTDIVRIKKMYNCNVEGKEETFLVGRNYTYTKAQAADACHSVGAVLATKTQLQKAQDAGASWCFYGWLADDIPFFPNNMHFHPKGWCGAIGRLNSVPNPFLSAMGGRSGANCYGIKLRKRFAWEAQLRPFNKYLWSVHDRTNISNNKGAKRQAEVFAVGDHYTYNKSQAADACRMTGAMLATKAQLQQAQEAGASWCFFGWLEDDTASFPNSMQVHPQNWCGTVGRVNRVGTSFSLASEGRFGATCYGGKPAERKVGFPLVWPFNRYLWSSYDRTADFVDTVDVKV